MKKERWMCVCTCIFINEVFEFLMCRGDTTIMRIETFIFKLMVDWLCVCVCNIYVVDYWIKNKAFRSIYQTVGIQTYLCVL